ncbi:hypothetical protein BDP55DRAFT_302934 [Colletotrichum godetiae]|uniref:Secreted protein n=1 Tax=Colletotrichum godetiae TaxID=1209918 RepID=A0AAJ0F2N2_9PEZI|nr:uncharacterized protein BDP55DRAFT_302934 [Colletotrichum godetiae]KAK1690673.1 hypothetical protein BDP55DRAFT_302934 [Colletotrichum godetiae]
MHTCFIALASASVLHLPFCLFFRTDTWSPSELPALVFPSPSPSGTLAGSLYVKSDVRSTSESTLYTSCARTTDTDTCHCFPFSPALSGSLFLFPPALCRVVLFAVVDTRKEKKKEASSEPTASLRFFPDQSYITSTITYYLPLSAYYCQSTKTVPYLPTP